jgi:hypothetical protein
MGLLGDMGHVVSCLGPFGDSLVSCAKRSIGSEIILDAPVDTPR